MRLRHLPIVLFALIWCARGYAYPVAYALPLDKLADQSDLVVKAQAIATDPVKDPAFTDYSNQGYGVFATRLKVISVLKGDAKLAEITFHHYDVVPDFRGGRFFSPQIYHFTPNQPYILFAKKSDVPGVFRTFSFNHTTQEDQGLLRAANSNPCAKDATVKDAIWDELTALIASKDPADVTYALGHLDVLSNALRPIGEGHEDFPRNAVLDLVTPLLAHTDPAIASAAVKAIGRPSPYWSDDLAHGWLATVGKGNAIRRGYGTYPANYTNPSAAYCRPQLVALANTATAPATLRAQAIRSLGRSRDNDRDTALLAPLRSWSGDPEPQVRAAAAVLWSDYPSKDASATIQSLAADQSPVVRTAAAYAIGFSQTTELLPTLDALLADPDEHVHRASAVSLLSFDPKAAAPILKSHLKDPRCFVAFTNALAEADPVAYRDDLVTILTSKPGHESLTGQVPAYTAWDILMNHIAACPPADLRAGKLDKYLDALESPPNIGSGPYQTLYRFYHEQKFTGRMQSFREKAVKQVTGYDLDYYFKQIDGRK
ncbi:MAG: HEAT repeat domain-containing protein [Tepidisphaerales bacterium]